MKNSAPDPATFSVLVRSEGVFQLLLGLEAVMTLPPLMSIVGYRVLFIEHSKGEIPTGRAALYRIDEVIDSLSKMTRTWNWTQGKFDDDLAFLGLTKALVV